MNGAKTEVAETTMSAPKMKRKSTIGRSQRRFFAVKYPKISRSTFQYMVVAANS